MLGHAVVTEGRRRQSPVLALSRGQADIADPEALADWVDTFSPQVVVNCAAFTNVDACETERDHALAINGDAVAHIAAAAARNDALLVHISSDYVFAGDGKQPYQTDEATGPISVYGESKLRGEAHALAYERGLVLRASWLFGPGGPNFPATMRRLMLEGKAPLRVVDDQVGGPTCTPYLARAIWDLADCGATGVVHYQNREPVSWFGFARAVADVVAPEIEMIPVPTSAFPRPAPRPAYSVLDTTSFETMVGRTVEPWLAGLTHYLDTIGH